MSVPRPYHDYSDKELENCGWDQDAERERRHRQNQKRLESIEKSQSEIKTSVDRVHRIDVWILIAGVVAALAGVILLVVEIAKTFHE